MTAHVFIYDYTCIYILYMITDTYIIWHISIYLYDYIHDLFTSVYICISACIYPHTHIYNKQFYFLEHSPAAYRLISALGYLLD